ncbi:helix-turn-helix domain-containing protein [Nocardia huaxiensis]|uniref:Helix-turn-helix domain-containing protein n=1 Tax=Nocardia huaxiensis TaxID=2755382 RepID=A0A7D6VII3_9NOCA|nr:LuxR C-terminal-related transcriptional regulator [Nocardia huaxiensis]QLY30816.1 helix-turn-helix domain-containing protein [Nocardia huaxiensis]
MIGNTPVALDSLPCAREIFRDLDSPDSTPPLYLIRGRSGTGKSTLLAAIRTRLQLRGVTITDRPNDLAVPGDPALGSPAGDIARSAVPGLRHSGPHSTGTEPTAGDPVTDRAASAEGSASRANSVSNGAAAVSARVAQHAVALVVDDAHTLGSADFEMLCAAVESGMCTVIIATLPRPHDGRLRALADLVARRGRLVDLRPLGVNEIAPFARELGMMVPRGLAQHIHRQTDGIHGGVVAALTAACATRLDAGMTAVDAAVTAWARTRLADADPDLLDTFVVAAIGAGLDASELSEVLEVSLTAAQDLVDRARSGALITDADLLLSPAVAPLRTLVGDRRFLAVQRKLLHARLDAGLLRDHTAVLLAESGVRDPRLAEFLCTTAEKAGDDAVRHYAAAAAAGADRTVIAVRWADAAARAGDRDTAIRLAEPALARPDTPPAELAAAVRICAGVWTRRGHAERAAQLYTWLGPHRVGPDWALAATVLYLSGDRDTARTLSVSASQWPPTEATTRATLIAEALADSTVGVPGPVVASTATVASNAAVPNGSDAAPTMGHAVPAPAASGTARTAVDHPRTDSTSGTTADRIAANGDAGPIAASHTGTGSTAGAFAAMPGAGDPRRSAAVAAASALIRAAHSGVAPGENGGDRFLPCSAVSIATLLCLSMGEPRRAADALRGSARDPQLLVLAAWVAMLGGDEQSAAAIVADIDVRQLDPRDRLLAHGVIVGLARRSGDHTALTLAWQAAYPLFDEVGADLLALLPIGELWLAGIRLEDEGRVTALVRAAAELLRQLGEPPAWANAFHWYAIQAAIAHESPNDLLPHAYRLKAAAEAGDPQAAALADAGRTWVLVLRGQVVRDQVEAAVRRLAALGLIWDAARLASEAALAAADAATATALLKLARTVRAQARPPESAVVRSPAPADPAPRPEPLTDTVLSEREREVAELVLLGLTYREIGARLYISAKTVEHHVARIRRRIGAGSRSELLSMLRAMGHGSLLV